LVDTEAIELVFVLLPPQPATTAASANAHKPPARTRFSACRHTPAKG
jgi:hypothetical protein